MTTTTTTETPKIPGFDLFAEMASVDLSTPIPEVQAVKPGEKILGTMSEPVKRLYILSYLLHMQKVELIDRINQMTDEHNKKHTEGVLHDMSECVAHHKEVQPLRQEARRLSSKSKVMLGIAELALRLEHPEWDDYKIDFRDGGVIVGISVENYTMQELTELFAEFGIRPVVMQVGADDFKMNDSFPEE